VIFIEQGTCANAAPTPSKFQFSLIHAIFSKKLNTLGGKYGAGEKVRYGRRICWSEFSFYPAGEPIY
jgi:hypothetical protein